MIINQSRTVFGIYTFWGTSLLVNEFLDKPCVFFRQLVDLFIKNQHRWRSHGLVDAAADFQRKITNIAISKNMENQNPTKIRFIVINDLLLRYLIGWCYRCYNSLENRSVCSNWSSNAVPNLHGKVQHKCSAVSVSTMGIVCDNGKWHCLWMIFH